MNQFDYYWVMSKQRHEEMLKQAEQIRLLNEAYKTEKPPVNSIAKFLSTLGKELSSLGFSLEVRYGGQPDPCANLNQQTNPADCV